MKTALISGITGQSASYLSEILLEKGYEVYGLIRNSTVPLAERIQYVPPEVKLLWGDMTDMGSLVQALRNAKPDLIFHLAASSFVGTSWDLAIEVGKTNGLGTLNLLEAMRYVCPNARMYNASTSEMYGTQKEDGIYDDFSPFAPVSPYGVAKLFAHHMCNVYRKSHGMFVSCGIAFNHSSPRRGYRFVTRQVSVGVAKIKLGLAEMLPMGNMKARRDWLHAKDVMNAAWLMLQQPHPDDFVIASNTTHSIEEVCEIAFAHVGLNPSNHIVIDEKLFRPNDVGYLCGDATKARSVLKWEPTISFGQIITEMVDNDIQLLKAKHGL